MGCLPAARELGNGCGFAAGAGVERALAGIEGHCQNLFQKKRINK